MKGLGREGRVLVAARLAHTETGGGHVALDDRLLQEDGEGAWARERAETRGRGVNLELAAQVRAEETLFINNGAAFVAVPPQVVGLTRQPLAFHHYTNLQRI